VEAEVIDDENNTILTPYKLPFFYFNFFNYVVVEKSTNFSIFRFRKVFKNYSRFIFRTEAEKVIYRLVEFFGVSNGSIYSGIEVEQKWILENFTVILTKDEAMRPELYYIIPNSIFTT